MPRQDLVVIEPLQSDYRPTDDMRMHVAKMVACGLDEFDIAFELKLEPIVVVRVFAQELKHGLSYFVGQVGGAMIDAALRGDVNAQRSFLQMRGRWTIPTKAETDNDTAMQDIDKKRKLMNNILDMVANKVVVEGVKVNMKKKK